MRISYRALPKVHLVVVVVFAAACVLLFGFLWTSMGGKVPGLTQTGYRVAVNVADVDNLVFYSDVRMAGVAVGKVEKVERGHGAARVVFLLDSDVAPLHRGATVRVGAKTLVEETYLDVADGTGAPIPDGGTLPRSAVKPSVQLNDVLQSFDPKTRRSFSRLLHALETSTAGTKRDLGRIASGLGTTGRTGSGALAALAEQEVSLKEMSRQTTILLRALDTRSGLIADMVDNAQTLTSATAQGRRDIEAVMRRLPGVLAQARTATGSLTDLSKDLTPVAADLRSAAPHLDSALRQLPSTTSDLRALLPDLSGTLDAAPSTLRRVPTLGADLRSMIPHARTTLADVNPMLAYLKPYGLDIAAFFATTGATLSHSDPNGHFLRVFMVFNEQTVKNMPLSTNRGLLDKSNAYPDPGGAADPKPFDGRYERVHRGPR